MELLNCVCDTTSCNWRMGECAKRGEFNRTETRLLQIEGPSAAGMQ